MQRMNEEQLNTDNQAPEAGEATVAGSPVELAQKLAAAEQQAEEYLDNWRRSVAELSNARKRMLREMEEFSRSASERVLEKLLPVLDDLDRALGAAPEDPADAEWVNGIRMIQRKLQGVLEGEGLVQIPAVGEQFDPELHHAVTHEETPGYSDGTIIAEVAKGYRLRDKVLRPTMVRVAK